MPAHKIPIEQRFWQKVDKSAGKNRCWIWSGAKDKNGYGRITKEKYVKTYRAHVFSYELHNNQIPKGMLVCHSCDNPPCVNPKHLWIGTVRDNNHDKMKKGRCVSFSGEKNPMVKLTDKKVKKILLL